MAFDALATTAFGNDPTAFLERNFVVPRGHTNLHGHTTKVGRNGVAPRDKILSAGIPFGALKLRVSDADTITVTSIGNRNRATAYIGLFELEEGRYEARISLHQAPNAPLKVFYLPSAANQILAVRLPDVGGPSICLTDPLSGCTIFTTTLGNDAWMFHANAHAVRNGAHDPPRRYMRDLFRHFTSASLHQPVKMFDRPMYEPDQAAWSTPGSPTRSTAGGIRRRSRATLRASPYSAFGQPVCGGSIIKKAWCSTRSVLA